MADLAHEKALRGIQVGDLFDVAGNHGAPITCLATAIDETSIYARSITHQIDFKFDRKTGVGMGIDDSLGGRIRSVAPLPHDIYQALIGLDRRYRGGGSHRLSEMEKKALVFIHHFYEEHLI